MAAVSAYTGARMGRRQGWRGNFDKKFASQKLFLYNIYGKDLYFSKERIDEEA